MTFTDVILWITLFLCVSNQAAFANESNIKFYSDSVNFVDANNNDIAMETLVTATHKMLFKEMGFKPDVNFLPSKRLMKVMKGAQPICTFSMLKNEQRARTFLFSQPTDIFLSHRLYQLSTSSKIDGKHLNKFGQLMSISDYFNNKIGKNIALIEGHSYGDSLDVEINKIKPEARVPLVATKIYEQYVNLFLDGRVDFVLLYPSVIFQIQSENQHRNFNLRSYGIADAKEYLSSRVMCNDTEATQGFISQVNSALKRIYVNEEFAKVILRFTPKNDHTVIDRIFTTELRH